MKAAHRYLLLPISKGAPARPVRLTGYTAEIELADEQPDFIAFLDIDRMRGDDLELDGTGATQADELPFDAYGEALRPQFHFSSMRGWNNDPNGLVRLDGEWHLFYQHNPFGTAWGNMHWGHAVSADLVRWRELGDALAPDGTGTMFSGSGVIDAGNTSGLGSGGEPPMVLLYTAAGGRSPDSRDRRFTQALAWSSDRGRSWSKLGPVLEHVAAENRDPKVVWHAPTRQWVMALYLEGDEYALFASPDLRRWRMLQRLRLEGAEECPDLFEIGGRWVFWGANGRYLVGDFDGASFVADPGGGPHTFSHGTAYAAQTWSGAPAGRVVQIAWLKGDKPGQPFNQQMTFPCDLELRATADGPRLASTPVAEIATLVTGRRAWQGAWLEAGAQPVRLEAGELLDISLEADLEPDTIFELGLRGLTVACGNGGISCCEHRAPLGGQRVNLRALVDRSSLELFAGGGLVNMPLPLIPAAGDLEVTLRASRGALRAVRLQVSTLRSAWG